MYAEHNARHIYSRWACKLKCADMCKQNYKVTCNYIAMAIIVPTL